MRVLLLAVVIACRPSASVERTMPVANLQTYRTVGLRVHSSAFASQGLAMMLESSVTHSLREKCGFEQVVPAGTAADVVLDLNITNHTRGGTGWLRNENRAVIDTLIVLSDGQDGELLGTAKVRGKSSGAVINNAPQEQEAIAVIASTIADLLAKSGCSGPRIARVEPPVVPDAAGSAQGSAEPADQGSAALGTPPADDGRRAQAEALNEQGKAKLFGADTAGALSLFQQANALVPDPKYLFNVCVALGAQERWAEATAACQQARAMNPPAKLAAKIDQRLEGLAQRQ